jgi:hypothetical protein
MAQERHQSHGEHVGAERPLPRLEQPVWFKREKRSLARTAAYRSVSSIDGAVDAT